MWTDDEKDALAVGVAKYGLGNWMAMKKDPLLGPKLASRTNIDLKDKWRQSTTPTKSGLTRTQPLSPRAFAVVEDIQANGGRQVSGVEFDRHLSPVRVVEKSPFGSTANPNEEMVASPRPMRFGFNTPPGSPRAPASQYTPRQYSPEPEDDEMHEHAYRSRDRAPHLNAEMKQQSCSIM